MQQTCSAINSWMAIMTTKHFVLDAGPEPTARLSAQPQGLVSTGQYDDPRLELSDQALVVASHNAFPVVANQKSRRDSVGLAAGAGIAVVLGFATFMSLSSSRELADVPASRQASTELSPQRPMNPPALAPGAAPNHVQPFNQPAPLPGGETFVSTAPGMIAPLPQGPAPVVVFDGSSAPAPASGHQPGGETSGPAPAMLSGAVGLHGLVSSDHAAARSTKIAEPANTVVQGTLIPAVLETAIDSDLPGYARAVVSQDIRSFDGSRILVPRSSRLIGEYKSGLAAGQKRAYLLWTRLVRPDGVSIALASPAADISGRSGVTGKVDTHFFERFGSAILLSVLGNVTAGASRGATVVVSGGQSAGSLAAQQGSQRPPTIRVKQGEPIRVFTARDLIFSTDGSGG